MIQFNSTGKKFPEAASLPVFQDRGEGINILIVVITSKMLFDLPFKTIDQVMETRFLLSNLSKKEEKYKPA